MPQVPALAGPPQDPASVQLGDLRAKVNDLKLHASDLDTKLSQLKGQLMRAPLDRRAPLEKQIADLTHEYMATTLRVDAMNQQMHELEDARDMNRVFALQGPPPPAPAPIAITTQPAPDSFPRPNDIMGILGGGAILLFPLVLVLARRLWVRGGPRTTLDLENSPRLQRIEQAIESIAVEVERIGEAQRFTTKLLSDRQPDAVARMTAPPRKEPGTITPH